ncbi:MAG: FKBP-type peptidyl-prolyl cis-trans isomerase [Anaerolineae bacterium]|nr:FKBP-type peptidyl-prolyl cis-trans isomerase [Anaerolineae bacterium]
MGHKEEGEAYLAENARYPDVQVTPSGLQYTVVREGQGAKPTAADTVEVHYTGKLINNKVFDSSYGTGEPVVFPLDGVIQGWTEGVQLMSVGSIYRFYLPYTLAYGDKGIPGLIPPYAVLIFEVELLGIK